jgi:hypothetical protein
MHSLSDCSDSRLLIFYWKNFMLTKWKGFDSAMINNILQKMSADKCWYLKYFLPKMCLKITYVSTCICKPIIISTVSIVTGCGLDDPGIGVRVPVRSRIVSHTQRPDELWGSPSLLPDAYSRLFSEGKSGHSLKLTIHLKLVTMSEERGFLSTFRHPLSWHGD